jgi:hypothetical protein
MKKKRRNELFNTRQTLWTLPTTVSSILKRVMMRRRGFFFIQSGSLLFVEYTNNNLYHTLIWSSSILYNKYKLKKNNYVEMYNRKTHRIISTREMTYMQVSTVEYVLYSRTDTDWNRFKTDDKQFYIDRSSFAIPRIFILITFELSNS